MARVQVTARDGATRWLLSLPKLEADLVLSLPARLVAVLRHPVKHRAVIDRLFPACYDDPAQEKQHRELLGASLLENRKDMLDAVRVSLAGAARARGGMKLDLDAAGVDLWLRFLNDLRLLLATELGIEKSLDELVLAPGDPKAFEATLLVYLGGLEATLVEALEVPPQEPPAA